MSCLKVFMNSFDSPLIYTFDTILTFLLSNSVTFFNGTSLQLHNIFTILQISFIFQIKKSSVESVVIIYLKDF